MDQSRTNWKQVRLFAILAFLLSGGGYTLLGITGETNIFLLAAPAVSALITKLITQRNLRGLQWRLPAWRWVPVAYLLPVCISGSAFVAYWFFAGAYDHSIDPLAAFLLAAGPIFMTTAIFAFGEELGWRGFLVPELAKSCRFSNVAMVTGVIWAIWHWPLILLSSDVTGLNLVSPWFALPVFTAILGGAGTVLAWVTIQSRSVWPAVVLHGSQNAFTHGFFIAATERSDLSPYFVSEAGGLLAIAWLAAATLILWPRTEAKES